MKPAKRLVQVGDHVKLRGREPKGVVADVKEKWVTVRWQTELKGPKVVHVDELEMALMYPDDGGLKQPVRSFDSTFSAVTVLEEMFLTKKEKE